ncbi:MAG TPA: hypothetical protein VET23_12875 [Chitinophagaceae bacterium]|nr:hypothetical protein [Chitinophagaceae bacterium]
MQLVKSTTLKRTKTLHSRCKAILVSFISFFILSLSNGFAQDNSPYSRYGLGDLVSPTNVNSRSMGGISAAYSDPFSINFNNPASYSLFQVKKEQNSKKLSWGRALLDLGVNFDSRTLRENTGAQKFVASNILFSYLQVGIPIRENWGMSFGLRPVTRISYKINKLERLYDPITLQPIDSSLTEYSGDGGTYLATLGSGYKIKKFSFGFNMGYMFGKKDYATKRAFINDSVNYEQSNYETKTSFGNIYFDAGIQYNTKLNDKISLTLGAYGNWDEKLKASQDVIRETFLRDPSFGDTRLDSVSEQSNVKGKIIYPKSLTIGFLVTKEPKGKEGGWQFGMDLAQTKWDRYRYYGLADSIRNKWELRIGTQLWPAPKAGYWSNVTYRAGFFVGPDYIKLNNKLPQFGASFGMGLPIANYRSNFNSQTQATIVNLTMEYIKRGNKNNLLRENLFRLSIGFSLSDLWFLKHKYD